MNQQRTQKSQLMIEKSGYAKQTAPGVYQVKSQFTESVYYTVTRTGNGLVCDCDDYKLNKADCKHIKVVLETIKANQIPDQSFKLMDKTDYSLCKFCSSGRIIKDGMRKNKNGNKPIFQCQECKRKFTANIGFEKMRYGNTIITREPYRCIFQVCQ